MRKVFRSLVAVMAVGLLAVGLSSCSSGGGSAVQNQDAAAFSQTVATAGVVILDVRTPGEFAAGHIQGAININVEDQSFDSQIASLDKSATYAVYCHSGRRSGIATAAMAKAGFTHLYNLSGGIQAWTSAGNALVTS